MKKDSNVNNIQAVLYDMDGLMVDTEPIHFEAFRSYMKRWKVDMPESTMPEFIGFSERENLQDLKAKYNIPDSLEEMVKTRRGIYLQLVQMLPIHGFPGFWEFSAAAKQRGLKQAVVSSASGEQVDLVLSRLFETKPELPGYKAYFDTVVTGDDVVRNKPAPDIYLEGARRLGIVPQSCLALEDSPPGVQAAVNAGMSVIAVPNEYTRGLEFPRTLAVLPTLAVTREYLDW